MFAHTNMTSAMMMMTVMIMMTMMMVTQHIPTMTKSHHDVKNISNDKGGKMSVTKSHHR